MPPHHPALRPLRYTSEFTVSPDFSGGAAGCRSEDGGQALIMYAPVEDPPVASDDFLSVRLHSFDEAGGHTLFRELMGRKVRITVETIDDTGAPDAPDDDNDVDDAEVDTIIECAREAAVHRSPFHPAPNPYPEDDPRRAIWASAYNSAIASDWS